MYSREKKCLPQECGYETIAKETWFYQAVVILDRGGDDDDFNIRCVRTRGAVLNVIVEFRGREQLWIVRPEEGGCFSDLCRVSNLANVREKRGTDIAREGASSKNIVLDKRFQELESAHPVVWFRIVDRNAELFFETQAKSGVIEEISAYARGINDNGDIVFFKERCRANTREHEDLRGMNCPAAVES